MNGVRWLQARDKHPIVLLEELCDLCSGITKGRKINSMETLEVPYMAVANVQDGKLSLENVKTINATAEEIERYRLLPGDLLLTEGGDPDKLGRGTIWNGEIDVCIHQNHIFRARKASDGIDMSYLARLVSSPYGKRYFLRQSKQTTGIASINMGQLKRFPVPLPPLEEQRRIAAILDKSSRLAELSATALNLSQAAEKSLFLDCFSDLPERSNFILEEVADRRSNAIRTGPFGSQLLHSEFTDSGVAVLGIDNAVNNSFEWGKKRFISHDKYQQLQRYTVFPGDLLITIMGTCGRAAVVPDDIPQAINTKHLCAITVDRSIVLPEYLHSYILFHPFASRYLGQRTKGAIMEGLNMAIIKEMPVAVPSLSRQLDWFAQREVVISTENNAKAMKASAVLLGQSLSVNLLGGRAV